jgi:mannose-6-phosphate isomerase-like protein (cupin superfamily)
MSLPPDAQNAAVSAIFRPVSTVETAHLTRVVAGFVAPGSVTHGEFGLFRWEMAPNAGGPDPHIHHTFSESFYVLEGRIRLFDGASWVEAEAGDFLFVPRNGIHAFRNESDEPAAMLILFAPGPPREEYFKALAENARSGRTMTDGERTAFLAEHDQYMVDIPS